MEEKLTIETRIHDVALAYLIVKYSKSVCDNQTFIEEYNDFIKNGKRNIDTED